MQNTRAKLRRRTINEKNKKIAINVDDVLYVNKLMNKKDRSRNYMSFNYFDKL